MTRAEILDVNLDQATREAMLQQLNAERARRAQVTEVEGQRRALKQVEALAAVGAGQGKQTIILPSSAIEAFGEAFKLMKGKS